MPVSRLKRLLAHPHSGELLNIMEAEVRAEHRTSASLEFVREYLRTTPAEEIDPAPLVSGGDLIDLGLAPGPQFKAWLNSVRDAQLEGEIVTRDAALDRLREVSGQE